MATTIPPKPAAQAAPAPRQQPPQPPRDRPIFTDFASI